MIKDPSTYGCEAPTTLPLPTWEDPNGTEDRFVGLFIVKPNEDNIIALKFGGDMTIDWGDGVVEDVTSSTQVEHFFDFNTLPDSNLTPEGYKQVIIDVVPQVGYRLSKIETKLTLSNGRYNASFTKVSLSGSICDLGNSFREQSRLEEFKFVGDTNSTIYLNKLFENCYLLEKVVLPENMENLKSLYRTFAGTHVSHIQLPIVTSGMVDTNASITGNRGIDSVGFGSGYFLNYGSFNGCHSLKFATGTFSLAGTNVSWLNGQNYALQEVYYTNSQVVTNWYYSFYFCSSLESITLDLLSATNCTRMFEYNYRLSVINLTNVSTSLDIKYATILPVEQLSNLIQNGLLDVTASPQTLTLTGTPSATSIPQADLDSAVSKGWTIIT